MNFSEYKEYANKADNALKAFEKEKSSKFDALKKSSLDKLTEASDIFKTTAEDLAGVKKALEDGVLKQKESIKFEGQARAFERKYKEQFEEFSKHFNKFEEANNAANKAVEKLRYDIVIEASVMRKAFVTANTKYPDQKIELGSIDKFLAKLKAINFMTLTTSDKNELMGFFDKMVHAQQGFFKWLFNNDKNVATADDVRKDFGKREKKDMETFLSKALEFAENSKKLKDVIIDGPDPLKTKVATALQNLNVTLDMDRYKVEITKKKAFANRNYNKLLEKYNSIDGADPNLGEALAAMEVPEEIDLINKMYLNLKWAYKNDKGKAVGEKLNQEKTFKKTLLDKKYEANFNLPIPTGPLAAFLTADISFGAKFEAKVEVESKLKLHNFLSSKETKYVSGTFSGTIDLSASLSLGLTVTLLHIAQAEGKAVITGKTNVSIEGSADFNKGDESNLASFDAKSNGSIVLDLTGKLELTVGLTKVLNWIVETLTGSKAEKTYSTDELSIARAERKANIELHLPIKSTNFAIPDTNFRFDGGRWIVTYPASEALKKQINTKIFGNDKENITKAQEMLEGGKLSDQEKAELMQKYSPALMPSNP